jgi:hypothetical protein
MLDRRCCNWRVGVLALIGLSALLACTSSRPQVSTAIDPWTNFPANATFVWDEAADREPDDAWIRELRFGPRLRRLTTEVLAERGYREVEAEPADYRVSYQLSIFTGISDDPARSVASLSILLIEASSNQRVFVGFARATPQLEDPEEARDARLRTLVEQMFAGFPPSH